MIYFLFAISLLISIVLWRKKSVYKSITLGQKKGRLEKKKDTTFYFLKGLLEFTVPFTIVSFIFSCLQFWLNVLDNSIHVGSTILELEKLLISVRVFFAEHIKMDPVTQLFIIALIITFGLFIPKLKELQALKKFKRITLIMTRAYILLSFIVSFTFFGNQLNNNIEIIDARINTQIEKIRQNYGEIYRELRRSIQDEVTNEVTKASEMETYFTKMNTVNRIIREIDENVKKRSMRKNIKLNLKIDNFKRTFVDRNMFAKELRPFSERMEKEVHETEKREFSEFVKSQNTYDWSLKKAQSTKDKITKKVQKTVKSDAFKTVLKKLVDIAYKSVKSKVFRDFLDILPENNGITEIINVFLKEAIYKPLRNSWVDNTQKAFTKIIKQSENEKAVLELHETYFNEAKQSVAGLLKSKSEAFRFERSHQLIDEKIAEVTEIESGLDNEIRIKAMQWFETEKTKLFTDLDSKYRAMKNPKVREVLELVKRDITTHTVDITKPFEKINVLEGYREALGLYRSGFHRKEPLETLMAFESHYLNSDILKRAFDNIIESEAEGRWGQIRQRMKEAELFRPAIGRWENKKHKITLKRLAESGTSEAITPKEWEKEFFKYTQTDNEMAVAWGWAVKDLNSNEVQQKYGRAIPEYGYKYYVEKNFPFEIYVVRRVFSRPESIRVITRWCR